MAVALGIGAALVMGQGVASAKPADTSGSQSSETTSSASEGSSTESTTDRESAADEPSEESSDTSDKDASTNDDDTVEDDPPPTKRSNKRWKASQESKTTRAEREAELTDDARDTPRGARSNAVETEAAEAEDAGNGVAEGDESTAAQDVATVTKTVETAVETAIETAAEPQKSEVDDLGDPVTVGISSLVSALVSPFAGDGDEPTGPVDSPAVWAFAAAARREFLGVVPSLDKDVELATNALVADDVAEMAALTVAEEPAEEVVAIRQTPLLTALGLQRLPIVGPLVVSPIIAVVHQIPFVGDILHPIIGYPVGYTGGTTPRDVKVISFDGTPIYVHFFPAQGPNLGERAPTILNGPGLGLPGETNPLAVDNPFLPNQVIGMGTLLKNGYNVVTWDPRGEWGSGGTLEIDHPDIEARDMEAIISWVAQQPEAAFDEGSYTDPQIGMVGASYGGGIQLVTAARDERVDAIVPTIAWNNLNTSLAKSGAPKTSWGLLLGAALLFTGARTDPQIYPALISALLLGELPQRYEDFLGERGPDIVLDQITAPTLLVQGTVDTLFTLQEAHDNAMTLIDNGVETKVVWYCGGHGGCITSTNNGEVIDRTTLAWLDRYVKEDPSVDTGPQFEWVDQNGDDFTSESYPVPTGTSLEVATQDGGTLPLRLFLGGSGPNLRAFAAGPIGGLLGLLSAAEARNAIELTTTPQTTTQYLVGAPDLEFTYSGTGSSSHVYAQLVDDKTGLVLGNHVTPVEVTLDGEEHIAKVPLEMIAHTLLPGQTVTLQIVASAVTYQPLWTSGKLTIKEMKLTMPTADASQITLPTAVEIEEAA